MHYTNQFAIFVYFIGNLLCILKNKQSKKNKTKQKSLGTSPYMKVFMFNFITFLNSKFTIAGESEIKLNGSFIKQDVT